MYTMSQKYGYMAKELALKGSTSAILIVANHRCIWADDSELFAITYSAASESRLMQKQYVKKSQKYMAHCIEWDPTDLARLKLVRHNFPSGEFSDLYLLSGLLADMGDERSRKTII